MTQFSSGLKAAAAGTVAASLRCTRRGRIQLDWMWCDVDVQARDSWKLKSAMHKDGAPEAKMDALDCIRTATSNICQT